MLQGVKQFRSMVMFLNLFFLAPVGESNSLSTCLSRAFEARNFDRTVKNTAEAKEA